MSAHQVVVWVSVAAVLLCLGSHASLPWTASPRTDAHFTERHAQLMNRTAEHSTEAEVIFLGASIVEFWENGHGKTLWEKHYAPRHAFNYGLSGDKVENVLWRIEQGELDHMTKVKVVVLFVGSNNRKDKPADVVRGLQTVVETLQTKIPAVQVILMSIFPRTDDNLQVRQINKLLVHLASRSVHFMDVTLQFESDTEPGHINSTLFLNDHLHPNEHGYQVWYDAMEPLFGRLLL